MRERMRPSADWYRRRIMKGEDIDPIAGPLPSDLIETEESPLSSRIAFGTFVRLERRGKRMSIAELASKLRVDESEVRQIEHDPAYKVKPRTIVSLATFFGVPTQALIKLSGAARSIDAGFKTEALRFAAHSDDIVGLSADEQAMLREFVQFLKQSR